MKIAGMFFDTSETDAEVSQLGSVSVFVTAMIEPDPNVEQGKAVRKGTTNVYLFPNPLLLWGLPKVVFIPGFVGRGELQGVLQGRKVDGMGKRDKGEGVSFRRGLRMNLPSAAPWDGVIKSFPYQMLMWQSQPTLGGANTLFFCRLSTASPVGTYPVEREPV